MISQSDVQFAPAQDGFRRTRPCEDHPSPRSGLRNVEPGVSEAVSKLAAGAGSAARQGLKPLATRTKSPSGTGRDVALAGSANYQDLFNNPARSRPQSAQRTLYV